MPFNNIYEEFLYYHTQFELKTHTPIIEESHSVINGIDSCIDCVMNEFYEKVFHTKPFAEKNILIEKDSQLGPFDGCHIILTLKITDGVYTVGGFFDNKGIYYDFENSVGHVKPYIEMELHAV